MPGTDRSEQLKPITIEPWVPIRDHKDREGK
jgi:hypothetical protein